MPSIYTHNYFSKELYKKLDDKKIIKPKDPTSFYIFSQSFDYLFSYNLINLKKGKDIRILGHHAHTHETWNYFKNIIEYMKTNELYDDGNIGYLYGSLSHYILDSTAHPYIHYISGRYNRKNRKDTKKYAGKHAANEIMIDSIYYYKDNKKPYNTYKLYNYLFPRVKFSETLNQNIDNAYKKTFDKENMSKIYYKAYNQCRFIYRYLMYDRFNIKKQFYKIFDFFTPRKVFKASCYTHHILKPDYNLLNLDHNIWLHPVTGDKHTESFEDLYNIAIKNVIKCIKVCNEYFSDKCDIDKVEKIIKNNSYSTGLEADIRYSFQYFAY